MPLIFDPERYSEATLTELVRSLRADLTETVELVDHPHGTVRDPASIETARELALGALTVLDRAGARTRAELAAEANLAYATMLAVIDLVKSHTDVPKVPRSRGAAPAGSGAPR
jgi:hypothetical protein